MKSVKETTSLYDLIAASVVNGELPRDFSLPKPQNGDGELFFADGARDGICIYHMGGFDEITEEDRALMIRALKAAAGRHTGEEPRGVADFEEAGALFEALGNQRHAIATCDALQQYVTTHKEALKAGDLYEAALWLVMESADRECVKFGLLLLETFGATLNDAAKETVRTVGLSDEFTYFAVRVIHRWPDGNNEIFRLAQKVHGWGRIHAIERLEPRSSSIKKWLLTEAVENDILDSYSALTCWNKSDARFVLRNHPDDAQFAGIRKILRGLLEEDAAAGISSMENRKQILSLFLDEAEKRSEKLELDDYQVIYDIYNYCRENEEKRSEISFRSKKILLTYRCACITIDAVKEGRAMEMAKGTGIDVKRYIPDLLRASLKDHMHLCGYMMQDEACRKETLAIFREQLPLEEMKKTPLTTLGIGDAYWKEWAITYLLQELRDYPCEGQDFVACGLQCESVRPRNSALYALECWVTREEKPLSELLPAFYELLKRLRDTEPTEFNRQRIDNLLSGVTTFEEVGEIEKDIEYSRDTLNILADAISNIGSWRWWTTDEDMIQLEFCDVQIYDDSKEEKEGHSSTVAVRFRGNYFAVFLDNLEKEEEDWFARLHRDELPPFGLNGYELDFDNVKEAKNVMKSYRRRYALRPRFDESLFFEAKHIIAGKCGDVGFVAGGEKMEIVGYRGIYTAEQIEEGNKRWWAYWEDYWRLRGTKDAYEKDYACEVTIPVRESG